MRTRNIKKWLLVLVFFAIICLFFIFDLQRYFQFDYIKAQQSQFQLYLSENPLIVYSSYFLIYVLVTALSLPGAAVMTLLGGALFGTARGTFIVSFASTLGATLAFLASRFALKDWVQTKFSERLVAINDGIQKEGNFYLFTLRLVPIFPFFLINLLMGLTPIRTRSFFWVSQIGMLPGTLVYVNAGKQLSAISSAAGIFTPSLLISFAVLGLFPLLAKKTINYVKTKRASREKA